MTDLRDDALEHLSREINAVPNELGGGRYAIEAAVGAGAMGEVFRARDRRLDRVVAIKICGEAMDRKRALRRFEREARVMARLEHPAIPPIHDFGQLEDGRPFYVMRLVPGETWGEAMMREPSRTRRLRTFLKLCEGVAYAHAAGFVHRDLKPDNVMLGPSGEVYVMDWGLACEVASPESADASRGASNSAAVSPRSAAGTPGFAAPEQARGAPAHPTADVYSLGALLAGLVTLENERTPAPLRSIVARAKASAPTERYPSAAELASDVAHFLDREPVGAHRESIAERCARLLERHRVLIWLIIGYLLMRALVVVFARA